MDDRTVAAALDAEVEFVLTLGGLALRLPGATLVTHEKIPVPRFNFVRVARVGAERQTAFFEHALDHYFQRALRPSFRVPIPVAPHLDSGLRRLGFVERPDPFVLLIEGTEAPGRSTTVAAIRTARAAELDRIAELWTEPKERPEFRTALDIAWHHPNPDEALLPIVAESDGELVAAALLYRHANIGTVHFVTTLPPARGRGVASDLVRHVLRERPLGGPVHHAIFAETPRLVERLLRLGFERAATFAVYELPASAQLALPPAGPPTPPRWRPPRGG